MSLSDYFRNVSARLFQIHSHNIVIHIEPVANVIIALSELVQSHPLIEVDSLVVPVDVQFQSAWRRMIAPNPIDCILKQEPSHVMSLIFGQHVNLLQVINVHVLFRFIFLGVGQWLDRHVADGLAVNQRGGLIIDEATGATSRRGVFAGGDAVTGAATVILAMGAGKAAAKGIHEFLSEKHA